MPAHIHPTLFWFAYEPVSFHGAALPGSVSRSSHARETTKCPEPLCPSQVLPVQVEPLCPIGGRYPSFIALTGSCARPPSSPLLGFRLVWWVFADCRQSLLDGGPSRRYLCKSFLGCLAPYPGVSSGASTRFFPKDFGLPLAMTRSAISHLPCSNFSMALYFAAAGIPLCSGLQVCLPPRSLRPIPTLPYGRRGVYLRTSKSSFPPSSSDMLTVRIGQLTVGDFHPIRLTALSAVPIAHGANTQIYLNVANKSPKQTRRRR